MNSKMIDWLPLFHIKSEVDKKDLSMNDLGTTFALTMMKKKSPLTDLLLVDTGIKGAVAEKNLSETSTKLRSVQSQLNTIGNIMGEFQEALDQVEPPIAAVLTEMIELVIDEDEQLAIFKNRIFELITKKEEWTSNQVSHLMAWLNQ